MGHSFSEQILSYIYIIVRAKEDMPTLHKKRIYQSWHHFLQQIRQETPLVFSASGNRDRHVPPDRALHPYIRRTSLVSLTTVLAFNSPHIIEQPLPLYLCGYLRECAASFPSEPSSMGFLRGI